jgi:hypothetical protein
MHDLRRRMGLFAALGSTLLLATGTAIAAGDHAALLGHLETARLSLADGIRQAEKEHGVGTSAKFEMKDGTLMLSVYTAEAGSSKDAEHNVLIELIGAATKGSWTPVREVFEDAEHLKRSSMHLTLVQASTISLLTAIKKAQGVQPGRAFSAIPAVREGVPVFDVWIATAEENAVHVVVDGRSGKALVTPA